MGLDDAIKELKEIEDFDRKQRMEAKFNKLKEFLVFCGLPVDRVYFDVRSGQGNYGEMCLICVNAWELDEDKIIALIQKRASYF